MSAYKISVVIPIYNCEKFIQPCLDSLFKQTMDQEDIQIVLVNDGSSDNSDAVCLGMKNRFDNIVYYKKENGGVSSARNKGIELATGKYIVFLDADDSLSDNTLAAVYDFFEEHGDEVDLVTYTLNYVDENGIVTTNKRYNVMVGTGVYDIRKNPNVIQTTMNICVKNIENPILFNEELSLGEDQYYIYSHLLKKFKIGFCKEAVYSYYRHSCSASSTMNNPYYCFPQFEKFLDLICSAGAENGKPNTMAQSLIVYNFGWRITGDMLVSHVNSEEEQRQTEIIKKYIRLVDNDIICNSVYLNDYHVTYMMELKGEKCEYAFNSNNVIAYSGNNIWFSQFQSVVFNDIYIRRGNIYIDGHLKLAGLSYKDLRFYYYDENTNRVDIALSDSAFGYFSSKTRTNDFGYFSISVPLSEKMSFAFRIEFLNREIIPFVYFGNKCAINKNRSVTASGRYVVSYTAGPESITVSAASDSELNQAKMLADEAVKKENRKAIIYRKAARIHSDKAIWLYMDRQDIFDNGYEQFRHDFKKKDGIKRYYIVDRLTFAQRKKFSLRERAALVKFNSIKHKLLFLKCSKILTSFSSVSIYNPFNGLPFRWYSDLAHFDLVYLQHGVLHANLPMLYDKEKSNCHYVVISSDFERNNFKKTYNFADKDLIFSGMPRLDKIQNKPAKNRILVSPSWRQNLIGQYIDNDRQLFPDRFLKSPFYNETSKLLNSEKLHAFLEKYDLELDFQNHPIFSVYNHYFTTDSPRVHIVEGSTNLTDYKVMITDYSSFVFDFVYLNRPILYFVPDYSEFLAGITHSYQKLDLPLEEGFGPIFGDSEALVESLIQLAERDFKPEEPYSTRINSFFESRETNHKDKLYEAVSEIEKESRQ